MVKDAKSGEDLTRSILLQIILEEEAGGAPMFSETVLANIIRFYGHAMQGYMGSYLEKNVQMFTDFQNKLAEQAQGTSPEAWSQFMRMQPPRHAEHDEQLHGAVAEHVHPDAGPDAKADRADAGCARDQAQ